MARPGNSDGHGLAWMKALFAFGLDGTIIDRLPTPHGARILLRLHECAELAGEPWMLRLGQRGAEDG